MGCDFRGILELIYCALVILEEGYNIDKLYFF